MGPVVSKNIHGLNLRIFRKDDSVTPESSKALEFQSKPIEHVQEQHPESESRFRRSIQTLNPFPWYRSMRESHPISYNEKDKLWEVFRYDDVLRVVNEYATFSSERVITERSGNAEEQEVVKSLLSSDPPRHRQLRSLISQAFTPRSIAQLTPRITEIVNEQLDLVAEKGSMDIIGDLSYPLPVIVIAEMLGIPSEDRDQFKRWSDAIVSIGQEEGMSAVKEMNGYFKKIIDQRRKDPKDDLISALIEAQIEGVHLSEPELLSFCLLLLVAGNETTTNLIGNALLCFDEHPEAMEQLRAEPALLPNAIEEVLRYLSPVQLLVRAAKVDTQIGEQKIKAGEIVLPWLGSANRDESQFPQPDLFDIRRTPNRHISFGHGIHFCVGAPLARLEAKIALGILLERFTDIRRIKEVLMDPIPSTFVYGVKNLPASFKVR